MCDVTISTVLRVLKIAGDKCEAVLQKQVREVAVTDVQADELWGFCFCKERNKRNPNDERQGDAWNFLAVERNSNIILAWHLGRRNRQDTEIFIVRS